MRIVLDTNLLVSGIISPNGAPRQLLEGVKAGRFTLCTSEALLAELLEVLRRDKFADRLSAAGITPENLVDDLRRLAFVVSPAHIPRVVATDPDDDQVIAAAITAEADLVASGDRRDLLPMGSFANIPIVTAREAIDRLAP